MPRDSSRLGKHLFTVNERVLLHLKESGSASHTVDLPAPMTQEGIATALGILVNHVSRAVKTLQDQGFIREAMARVKGDIRRRKIYLITEDGMAVANGVAKRIGETTVSVRDSRQRLREMPASEARHLLLPPRTYTAMLGSLDERGVLDVFKAKAKQKKAAAVSRFVNAPPEEAFHGRAEELKELKAWLLAKKPPAMAVTGHAGIGKTALTMQAVRSLEGRMPIFWFSFSPEHGHEQLREELLAFLREAGRPDIGLQERGGLDVFRRVLDEALDSLDALFVLDGELPDEVTSPEVVRMIIHAASATGNRVLITSREPLPAGHDLRRRALLGETRLDGLDRDSCRKLAPNLEEKEFLKAFKLARGNPLEIKLLSEHSEDEEEVKGLSPEERALLRYLRIVHNQQIK